MHGRSFTAGLLLGLWAGSAVMAAVGWHLARPQPHTTLPRPAPHAAPAPPADPASLIPPQRLPTRPNFDE